MITDQEMVFDALRRYAAWRTTFAEEISTEGYKYASGDEPAPEDIAFAIALAEQANRLATYAKEKMESPVIVMQ